MKYLRTILLVATSLATAAPASAQYQQYQPTQQYQRDLNTYADDRADYAARRADYERARDEYEMRRNRYERDRARYDARYGSGAYARIHGPPPSWDRTDWERFSVVTWNSRDEFEAAFRDYERARMRYDRRYGYGAYARRYGPPPVWDANLYGRDASYASSYAEPCRDQNRNRQIAGGILGALAGAALGSNVAARNAKTEGAVLGAVVGGAIGAGIGKATAKCDDRGYFYSYDQTIPYRESIYDRRTRSGAYDYSFYSRQRCRLAPAPIDEDGDDYRYVRVCPDSSGRYRITG